MNELIGTEGRDLVPSRGERYMAALSQPAKFAGTIDQHHRPFYDDYNVAKAHIEMAVGDLTDLQVFGRQVLCGVFIKPNITPGGFYLGTKAVKEDWWQGKVVLILKMGPEAFRGLESYHNATFGLGQPSPQVGDWLFCNANAGIQVNIMSDKSARPQGRDHMGRDMDLFEWDGWPCRIIGDDNFLGRILKPHSIA